jgi:hypothetical protein
MARDKQSRTRRLVFRGTSRYWMTPACLVFGAACVYGATDEFRTAAGLLDVLKGMGWAIAAPIVLWWGVRTAFCGIRADSHGVKITNIWFRYYIPWNELNHIIIHEESDEGVGEWALRFHRSGGKPVTASFPRGHSGPGEETRLDRDRLALLGLRDEALEGRSG